MDEGMNYLAFLVVLKNLLPGKSVSIAAPASYWYLKGFRIEKISNIVDYIVYMAHNLHGQVSNPPPRRANTLLYHPDKPTSCQAAKPRG